VYKIDELLNCRLFIRLTIPAGVSILRSIYAHACETLGKNIAKTINIQNVMMAIKIRKEQVKYITIRTRTTVKQVNTTADIRPSNPIAKTIPYTTFIDKFIQL
jgi:hypothetical protein